MYTQQLKNLNEDGLSLEQALDLYAHCGALQGAYETFGVEFPEWLSEAGKTLKRTIRGMVRDRLRADLARAKARKESLATPTEQRRAVNAEIERLEAALGDDDE